jgi:hypothetical protein
MSDITNVMKCYFKCGNYFLFLFPEPPYSLYFIVPNDGYSGRSMLYEILNVDNKNIFSYDRRFSLIYIICHKKRYKLKVSQSLLLAKVAVCSEINT